jgi:hypothetical protein
MRKSKAPILQSGKSFLNNDCSKQVIISGSVFLAKANAGFIIIAVGFSQRVKVAISDGL